MNPASKKIDQSPSDFQTGIGAIAHAILDKEKLISYNRAALVDTVASLRGSNEGAIAASEVHELLTKIYDILDSAVLKQVSNTAPTLGYPFNSASRKHCEVWLSQFPFIHNFEVTAPPSEACLYGYIN